MQRSFLLTLTVNFQNLYSLMVAVPGAIPTDGILPDRVSSLNIRWDSGTGKVTIADSNSSNTRGVVLQTGGDVILGYSLDQFVQTSLKNTICIRDYRVKGATGNEKIQVTIESQ